MPCAFFTFPSYHLNSSTLCFCRRRGSCMHKIQSNCLVIDLFQVKYPLCSGQSAERLMCSCTLPQAMRTLEYWIFRKYCIDFSLVLLVALRRSLIGAQCAMNLLFSENETKLCSYSQEPDDPPWILTLSTSKHELFRQHKFGWLSGPIQCFWLSALLGYMELCGQ